MASRKEFIKGIRRKKYLIDVQMAPEHEEGAKSMRGTLNRTLKLLSRDIYTKETHFVLELVQNADDNAYSPGRIPEMCFLLKGDSISVSNNEVGFQERHVGALCDAGKSTKEGARSEGFIGEKGIGFKSVFTVCDRPEIHSNGFHFRFDASEENPLGYVVPEWIDGCSEDAGTRIVLPAKNDHKFSSDTLAELSPELLLFLRRLRRLSVEDQISVTKLLAERDDHEHRVVLREEITQNDGSATTRERSYLCVHHLLAMDDVREKKRDGVAESEIVLAFPVRADGSAEASENQRLFAYLPVRSYGFKFLIQGDFLLNAGREDVHRNLPWNTRIRNQISEAFAVAVSSFKIDKLLAQSFLSYVPDASDITDDFFRVAAEQIVSRLKLVDFVLGTSGNWLKPSQILLVDEEFLSLFSAQELWSRLKLDCPADEFAGSVRKTLIRLGASEASLVHVLGLLESDADLANRPADWFARLYQYLEKRVTNEVWLKKFRGLAFLRLEGGRLAKMVDGEIFFPLLRGRKYGFENELNVLDNEIVAGSAERSAEVQGFLRKLGVRAASPFTLIRNHILPRHATDAWKTSDTTALRGHVRYIKDNLVKYVEECAATGQTASQATEQLATGLYLQTKNETEDTTFFGRPRTLYLPREYGTDFQLDRHLGGLDSPGIFVSSIYLPEKLRSGNSERSSEATSDWRTFLFSIGVNKFPIIVSANSGNTTDYDAGPELAHLLASENSAIVKALLHLIDKNWAHFSAFCFSRTIRKGVITSGSAKWVNSLRGVKASTTTKRRVPLCETYLNTDSVRAVFGKSADYLDASVSDIGFLDASGVTYRINAAACFKRLDQLRAKDHVRAKDVRAIYRALEGLLEQDRATVEMGFRQEPRIYIPSSKAWFDWDKVVWESNGNLLDSLYPPLDRDYAEHRTFFCKGLSVPVHPPEEALVDAVEHLPEFEATPEQRKHEAFHIYRRLSVSLRQGRSEDFSYDPYWLNRLKSEDLFLDHKGALVGADANLYVDDDARLAALFSDHAEISIFAVDRTRVSAVQTLLDECEIPNLSRAVTHQLVSVARANVDEELTGRIRRRTGAIMQFVFHRAHGPFERAAEKGIWAAMARMTVKRVANLEVEAKLAEISVPHAVDIYRDGNTIYLHADAKAARDKVCRELCFLIGVRDELADSIHRVLFANSNEELAEILEVKGIEEIPPDELERLEALARKKQGEQSEGEEEEAQPEPVEDPEEDDSSGGAEELGEPRREAATEGELRGAGRSQDQADTAQATTAQDPGAGYVPRNTGDSARGAHTRSSAGSGDSRPPTDRKRPSGRLMSYAEPKETEGDEESDDGSEEAAERREVAEAAVAYVMEEERKAKNDVQEMSFNNEGFDILRTTPDGGQEFIEVKGQSGPWSGAGVILSPPELRFAERYRDHYFLYVVEFAKEPARRNLYRVQDPFGKTKQFRFDSGWKEIAIKLGTADPAVGMNIAVAGHVGRIMEVRRRGQFFALVVETDGGGQMSTLFVPGKMRLTESQ